MTNLVIFFLGSMFLYGAVDYLYHMLEAIGELLEEYHRDKRCD